MKAEIILNRFSILAIKNVRIFLILFIFFPSFLSNAIASKIDCNKIEAYSSTKAKGSCQGEVHHLIEKRFAECLRLNPNLIPSICLSRKKHRVFTNRWRELIPYQGEYSCLETIPLVVTALAVVYAEDPCVTKKLVSYLKENAEKVLRKVNLKPKYHRFFLRAGVPISALIIAYQTYFVFANLDDNFLNDEFIEAAFPLMLEAINHYQNDNVDRAMEIIGEAYFLVGYAGYNKMLLYKTEYLKEITNLYSQQSKSYADHCTYYLRKSVQLQGSFPHSHFCLAACYETLRDYKNARYSYEKAYHLFINKNDSQLADESLERMLNVSSLIQEE